MNSLLVPLFLCAHQRGRQETDMCASMSLWKCDAFLSDHLNGIFAGKQFRTSKSRSCCPRPTFGRASEGDERPFSKLGRRSGLYKFYVQLFSLALKLVHSAALKRWRLTFFLQPVICNIMRSFFFFFFEREGEWVCNIII